MSYAPTMKRRVIPIVTLCAVFGSFATGAWVAHAAATASPGSGDTSFGRNLERAEVGDVEKQAIVGFAYLDGNGVEKNKKKGLYWLNSSISAGNASAAYDLAGRYETGNGVEKNTAEAVRYYHLAADGLSALAQRELGRIYAAGSGVPRDLAQAYARYDLASRLGYDDALEPRDALAKELSAEQLEVAKKTAQTLWSHLPLRKTKVAELNRKMLARSSAPKSDKPAN